MLNWSIPQNNNYVQRGVRTMFKKIIFITSIMISSSMALATTPYVGGSLGVANVGSGYSLAQTAKIFAGLGNIIGESQILYLGSEFNVDAYHYPGIHMIYGAGVSFIPGIMLTQNTMVYARLGVEGIKYHDDYTRIYGVGTQLGLGLQTSLTNHWNVRGEVDNDKQLNVGLVYKFN